MFKIPKLQEKTTINERNGSEEAIPVNVMEDCKIRMADVFEEAPPDAPPPPTGSLRVWMNSFKVLVWYVAIHYGKQYGDYKGYYPAEIQIQPAFC